MPCWSTSRSAAAARPRRLPRVRRHVVERLPDATVEVERVRLRGAGGAAKWICASPGRSRARSTSAATVTSSRAASAGEMRLRQMVEINGGRIAFSSLSFDVQDIVQQLVNVDVPTLFKRLDKIRDLHSAARRRAARRHVGAPRRARSPRDRARCGAPDSQAVFRPIGSRRRSRLQIVAGLTGPQIVLTADVRRRGRRAHRRWPR